MYPRMRGPWSVVEPNIAPTAQPRLWFALDRTSGRNGDHVKLTITTLVSDPSGGAAFMVVSTLDPMSHSWFGLVGM
jgi:hypothetical protein